MHSSQVFSPRKLPKKLKEPVDRHWSCPRRVFVPVTEAIVSSNLIPIF